MRRFGLALGVALAVLVAGSVTDATPQTEARTAPPAAAAKQALQVSIQGPTYVLTHWTCNWTAYVYGGTPPYTFTWYPQSMTEDYSSGEYWSGHASQGGEVSDVRRQMANFSVSMDRAAAVAQALQRYGVPGEAIAISAQVDDVAMNDAGGRRADVFLR